MTKKQEQALKELPQTGFHFSPEAHLYVLDGKPLTGVTTILGVIAKPNLIQWAANLATAEAFMIGTIEGLKEEIAKYPKIDTDACKAIEALFPDFKLARTAHLRNSKKAASKGTDVHAWIEEQVKNAITFNDGKLKDPTPPDDIKDIANNFLKWAKDNDITFLESEKRLFSREHWYAGTCDLVFLKDGKKHIGDIKTNSGIYGREYFFQMAGYQIALEEQGLTDIFANTIIRCGKDGSFEVRESFDTESDKKGFLSALSLYRELERE